MISLQIDKMFYGGLDGSFVTLRNSTQSNVPFIVNVSCVPTVCPCVSSSLSMLFHLIAITSFKKTLVTRI